MECLAVVQRDQFPISNVLSICIALVCMVFNQGVPYPDDRLGLTP